MLVYAHFKIALYFCMNNGTKQKYKYVLCCEYVLYDTNVCLIFHCAVGSCMI